MGRRRIDIAFVALVVIVALGWQACDDKKNDDTGPTTQPTAQQSPVSTTPPAETPTTASATAPVTPNANIPIIDPCSLATMDEVAAVLGDEVGAGVSTDLGVQRFAETMADRSTCVFTSAAGTASLSFDLWTAAPGDAAIVANAAEVLCTETEEITGLGDRACWFDPAHTEVRVGVRSFHLSIIATTPRDVSDGLLTLARQALDRLP